MEGLRAYFLSITAAAILCSCIRQFAVDKGSSGKLASLICNLFMIFTVIQPVAEIEISDFALFTAQIHADAGDAVAVGQQHTDEALSKLIKSRTEAYILDKARMLELDITVNVELSEDNQHVPVGVHISGNVSPYAKAQLQQFLTLDLGITKEDQIWMN